MKITFRIDYRTRWGEQLFVYGNDTVLGGDDKDKALPMSLVGEQTWELSVEMKVSAVADLRYGYLLRDANSGSEEVEFGDRRSLPALRGTKSIVAIDAWRSASAVENVFATSPFENVLLKANYELHDTPQAEKYTHAFEVKAPLLTKDEVLCIVGGAPELGAWDVEKALLMTNAEYPYWKAQVAIAQNEGEIQYKYGVYNVVEQSFSRFEYNDNRVITAAAEKEIVAVHDNFIRFDIDAWHGAGVSIPLFSLRTEHSFGCGDFSDLKLMVDWAKRVGMKLIQVLPLNDTIGTHTDADVLPYAAISAFALNPLFLDIDRLKLKESSELRKEYLVRQPELNAGELMDYLEVINFKIRYVEAAYRQAKRSFLRSADFRKFFEENKYWLKPYAVYCCLRDRLNTCDYREWGECAVYNEAMVDELSSAEHPWFDDVAKWWYCQYQLHLQLLDAVEYAHANGIVIKGDIPIGVNRNSVDTWMAPELFNMNVSAGAPPDMFAVKGQNWELPTYNWELMASTGFDWWKRRFEQMARYFDTFRIDHILGFFRIWQIPRNHREGIMGYLNPSIPLAVEEFEQRGLWFDYERFTKPYITDHILWQLFGDEQQWVKDNCLYVEYGFAYRIRPEYQNQTEVERRCQAGEFSERVMYGLFDLISNVLLFEVEGSEGRKYYPRYGMQALSTYAALSQHQKEVFDELYVNYFYRRQDAFWYDSGYQKLAALKAASNMLICGEDLGMMTNCVMQVMKNLSILSLEIQRAPKTDEREFFHPADAPYLSVVTPSTHDMSTIRGWWEEDFEVTQRFYNNELGHMGKAPFFCEWWICRDILMQHLYSPAMWAIFQWQDLMGIDPMLRRNNPNDERINVPSNSLSSWRYRMHITLEELLTQDNLNDTLLNWVRQSGR